tara:strand:+ start:819 stop:1070 length:252 start_codon:yes stop_codon:yes gene_type:complete
MPKTTSKYYNTRRCPNEKFVDLFEHDNLEGLEYENISESDYLNAVLGKGKFKGTDFGCVVMERIEPFVAKCVKEFIKSKSEEV